MKRIPLTQGLFAIVDDEDFDFLNQWQWCAYIRKDRSTGLAYAVRGITVEPESKKRRLLRMHRAIINCQPHEAIDHINCDGLDNRRSNLRIVNITQNAANRRKGAGLSSVYKGVCWGSSANKWIASINYPKSKRLHLGMYEDEAEAALAYNEAAIRIYGQYARINELTTEKRT